MKPATRTQLLTSLNNVVDRATRAALNSCRPVVLSKKQTLVGNISIERNSDTMYVLRKSRQTELLYSNISLYETAVLLAQAHISNNAILSKELIDLDKRYSKHYVDMINHLACYKILKIHKDYERMLIVEDKFILSDEIVKSIKYQLNCIRTSARH